MSADVIRLFVGYDLREEVGTHVFNSSVLEHCSRPAAVTHLKKPMIEQCYGGKIDQGTNAFTASRFLVPFLCDFVGTAVFVDGADMLLLGDLAELLEHANSLKAVSVVKHDYETQHPRKYVGTAMEADNLDYERKQWASVMVFNCWHQAWKRITPHTIGDMPLIDLLQFRFLQDDQIGSLPMAWNWLADEHGANPNAKLLHWTAGVPGFDRYRDAPHAVEWRAQLAQVNYATR